MDAMIKLLSRALAGVVKAKGKLIYAKAEGQCTASNRKLALIEQRIENLESQLQTAHEQRVAAEECYQNSLLNQKAARDVQAHYEAHAEEVLGFYPSTVKAVDEEDLTETFRYNKFYKTYERIPTKE